MKFAPEFSFHTREWVILKDGLQKDLDNAMGQVCNLSCGPDETQQLRGRINYIKSLLANADAAAKERQL